MITQMAFTLSSRTEMCTSQNPAMSWWHYTEEVVFMRYRSVCRVSRGGGHAEFRIFFFLFALVYFS